MWFNNRFIYLFQSLEFPSFQTFPESNWENFDFSEKINKSLDFIAFANYSNIVLSFFKNNPNISLLKLLFLLILAVK